MQSNKRTQAIDEQWKALKLLNMPILSDPFKKTFFYILLQTTIVAFNELREFNSPK